MTIPRLALLAFAVLALADGAVGEAVGFVAFVIVLCVFWPAGFGRGTPWPQR